MNWLTDSAAPLPRPLQFLALMRQQDWQVRQLSGYLKSHRLPADTSAYSQDYVARIAQPDVLSDLDETYDRLRRAFRFKRRDMQSHETGPGGGYIDTPLFRYRCTVQQHDQQPDQAVWTRAVCNVHDARELLTDAFAAAFGQAFDTVQIQPPDPLDLALLIDHLEDQDDPHVLVDYDRQLTYCEVKLSHHAAVLRVTSSTLSVCAPQPTLASQLMHDFVELQRGLVDFSLLIENPAE